LDANLFKVVGAVAGIGGIALAAVVYIFREVIRKEIFPQLTKDQAYRLLNRIIVYIFIIGVLGIIAYVVLNYQNNASALSQNAQPVPATPQREETAQLWGYLRDTDEKPLLGVEIRLEDFPQVQAVRTASDGFFWIKKIPSKYGEMIRLRVIKEGYHPNPCVTDILLDGKSHFIYLTTSQKPSRLPC